MWSALKSPALACGFFACLAIVNDATAQTRTITVSPQNASVTTSKTIQFSAKVSFSSSVTWEINGVKGGNSTNGTITSSGRYTAPVAVPIVNPVTVTARSTSRPTITGSTKLTVVSAAPTLTSVTPAPITVGSFIETLNGSGFAANAEVLINGTRAPATYVSATRLTVASTVAAAGTLAFAVRQGGTAAVTSNTISVAVVAPTIAVAISPTTASVDVGATKAFTATVTGTTNTGVAWTVNGVVGGSANTGTISSAGLFTAPATLPTPNTVTVRAVSLANTAAGASATVTLTQPQTQTGGAVLTAARFLEQSSFGPTPASLARVQQIGVEAYLDEQLNMTPTVLPAMTDNPTSDLQQWMLHTYSTAPDQLRQRVAYALSQIVVTSGNKLTTPGEILPWLRVLNQQAFGNYRDLLREITTSPSMGKYLDLANSMKPGLAGGANENYPRELLQLFTVGLVRLNQDGSIMTGADGLPVPTYSQDAVRQLALALTGWTYATAPGATPKTTNWEYFGAPMESRQTIHDTTAKTFLGCSLPAAQTVEQDLDATLNCLMAHPNLPPFIATRLIRSLVTSNPSPQYIKRVADVFAGVPTGLRGDLRATVRAILTDPEARLDAPAANQGRLKEPILQTVGFLRALNGSFGTVNLDAWIYERFGQAILAPPSVFSWYSPLFKVSNGALFGPEFQIYGPNEAVLRGNFIYQFLYYANNGTGTIDLTPFQTYANDMPALVDAVDRVLTYGRMPSQMKQSLVTAATPGADARTRIATVVYLTALSGQYAVQY